MLTVASAVANAQVYTGGTLGFAVDHARYQGNSDAGYMDVSTTSNAFAVAPEIGYKVDDSWAVGLTLGYQYEEVSETGITTISVLPYIRGIFAHAGIFDFFCEGTVGYARQSSDKNDVNGLIAGLRPGFVANFSKKFGLVGKTVLVKYNHFDSLDIVGFAFNSNFEIGVQYTF